MKHKKWLVFPAVILVIILFVNRSYIKSYFEAFRYAQAIRSAKPLTWKMKIRINDDDRTADVYLSDYHFFYNTRDNYKSFAGCVAAAEDFLTQNPEYFLNHGYKLCLYVDGNRFGKMAYVANYKWIEYDFHNCDELRTGPEDIFCYMRANADSLSDIKDFSAIKALTFIGAIDDASIFARFNKLQCLAIESKYWDGHGNICKIEESDIELIRSYLPDDCIIYFKDKIY